MENGFDLQEDAATEAGSVTREAPNASKVTKFPNRGGVISDGTKSAYDESDLDVNEYRGALSPVAKSQKKYFDQRAGCFYVLKIVSGWLGAELILAVAILTIYGAYFITSIAEPMGELKAKMEYLERDVSEVRAQIDNIKQVVPSSATSSINK